MQQDKFGKKPKKLALRIIFWDLEHYYEQLAAADVPTLCDVLEDICKAYAKNVTADTNKPTILSSTVFLKDQKDSDTLN